MRVCDVTLMRVGRVELAAALCGAVGDWRHRCFGGLNLQTHNFSGLEEGNY